MIFNKLIKNKIIVRSKNFITGVRYFINRMSEENSIKIVTRESGVFGDLEIVQDPNQPRISFFELSNPDDFQDSKEIFIRARIQNCRAKANNAFLELRQNLFTIQGVLFKSESISKEIQKSNPEMGYMLADYFTRKL